LTPPSRGGGILGFFFRWGGFLCEVLYHFCGGEPCGVRGVRVSGPRKTFSPPNIDAEWGKK